MKGLKQIIKVFLLFTLLLVFLAAIEQKTSLLVRAAEETAVDAETESQTGILSEDEEQNQQIYILIVLGGLLMLVIIVAVIVAASSVVYTGIPMIFKDIEEE